MDTHVDHIDPTWSKGRDYMLVCGLPVEFNLTERDPSLNIRKGNRFLPWKNSRDELGGDPINQGDLCLFLDPDTDEWVLEEFMGEWWFDKSFRFCHQNKIVSKEVRKKISTGSEGKVMSLESRKRMSESKKGRKHTEEHNLNIKKSGERHQIRKRLRQMSKNDPLVGDFEE